MPCYHPLTAWVGQRVNESGKRPVAFRFNEGFKDRPVGLPCGVCVGCRLRRAQQWAMRCMHEAALYERNCFVTLTYNADNVPADGSLRPRDVVLFLKRLRSRYDSRIRFFQVGEYGERLGRPHHHLLLFNHRFDDAVKLRALSTCDWKRSDELDELWPFGFSSIGEVTYQSAGYVARYSLKKVYGAKAPEYYGKKVPPYCTMSRKPGIGAGWLDQFGNEVYPSDEVIVEGKPVKPPRFYDERYSKVAPEVVADVKNARVSAARMSPDNSGSRLIVREMVREAALANLSRSLEDE